MSWSSCYHKPLIDSVGDVSHLHASGTTLVPVSRAPIDGIERFRTRMGWNMPWHSPYGTDFNYSVAVLEWPLTRAGRVGRGETMVFPAMLEPIHASFSC